MVFIITVFFFWANNINYFSIFDCFLKDFFVRSTISINSCNDISVLLFVIFYINDGSYDGLLSKLKISEYCQTRSPIILIMIAKILITVIRLLVVLVTIIRALNRQGKILHIKNLLRLCCQKRFHLLSTHLLSPLSIKVTN